MDDWRLVVGGIALLSASLQVLAIWWARRREHERNHPCRRTCQYAIDIGMEGHSCSDECQYGRYYSIDKAYP